MVLSGACRTSTDLAVEGHDRAERVPLRYEPELAGCLLIVLAECPHLLLLDGDERLLEEVSDGHAHDVAPDALAVVEDARVLLLLLRAVEEAPLQGHQQVLEHPLQQLPAHEVVLVHEELRVVLTRLREFQP